MIFNSVSTFFLPTVKEKKHAHSFCYYALEGHPCFLAPTLDVIFFLAKLFPELIYHFIQV